MSYDSHTVLSVGQLTFSAGEMVSIVGPNGAGKSTLLGIMAGLREGYSGSCRFEDKEVRQWKHRAFARSVSFVAQSLRLEFPFSAAQVVYMGRTPYCDGLFETPADRAAVERSMVITDTAAFADRDFRSLSGGERQRVVLASALAQEPRVLLLDEPATYLDVKHQLGIHRLLKERCAEGILVVAATHDLNLAAAYSDRIIVLEHGKVVADAPPAEALRSETIQSVFEVSAQLQPGPDGRPWIRYDA